MRLDSANRSFVALMSLALLLGMYVLCGAVGSVLVPLVVARISHDGIAGLLDSGGAMLPVLLFIILVAAALAFGARSIARQIVALSDLPAVCVGSRLSCPTSWHLRHQRSGWVGAWSSLMRPSGSLSLTASWLPASRSAAGFLRAYRMMSCGRYLSTSATTYATSTR